MPTTTKRELIEQVALATSRSRATVREVVQCFLDQVTEEIGKGNRLEFRDFGVFEVRQRGPRTVRNPRTQEPIAIAPDRTVKFKCGRAMKQAIECQSGKSAALVAGNGKAALDLASSRR